MDPVIQSMIALGFGGAVIYRAALMFFHRQDQKLAAYDQAKAQWDATHPAE